MTRDTATGLNNIHDRREFVRRLTETIAWCRAVGSLSEPRASLRMCKPTQEDLTSQSTQVFKVCLERSRRLSVSGRRNLSPVADLCGGRLLAYFPDDNLCCGTAEAESQGFFDVDNIPPYDTWVWMVQNVRTFAYADGVHGEMDANYLVAWVPSDFIQLAGAGLAVNPEACILWLDTLDDGFVRSLRLMGFLA
ncbi:hypothetical protein [Bradyrhizobium sp. CB3481]|uniref:hypothetical protein n=1 Tax=Bradyrhizobium sp. CB3481 TaxID=3039158 RepID=UPI0024B03D4E|nr:hypothetical protein [Bradyrhizobium sp. CB3481]WFU20342.1 hypothetical protein QA643_19385 [Bradyrhizobium sp. CB3481]